MTPLDVVRRVRETLPDTGQINIVDTEGRSISATGPRGRPWQGQRYGKNYATSGNISGKSGNFTIFMGLASSRSNRRPGRDVQQLQRYLRTLGYLEGSNRDVFDGQGAPLGVFNDATAEATTRWKNAAGLAEGGYLVPFMLRKLEQEVQRLGEAR